MMTARKAAAAKRFIALMNAISASGPLGLGQLLETATELDLLALENAMATFEAQLKRVGR